MGRKGHLQEVINKGISEEREKRERDKREAEARIRRLEYILQVLNRGDRKEIWQAPK